MIAAAAVLVFLAVVTTIVGLWVAHERRRELRGRLTTVTGATAGDDSFMKAGQALVGWRQAVSRVHVYDRIAALSAQAGREGTAADVLMLAGALGIAGGLLAWWRTGAMLFGLVGAAAGGALPLLHLAWRRQQRLKAFERQFPDALDIMTRSLRAGHALGGAIQHVAENNPDPVGAEFHRVADEIRLGVEPGEALSRMQIRVPTADVRFFCIAIRIQRAAGGNLAEVLDRLSEVIRERFKILSQARALAAQHKWSAVCVGLSPLVFAVMFGVLNPTYFDPLWRSEYKSLLLGVGFALEVVGFLSVWKIAQIEV